MSTALVVELLVKSGLIAGAGLALAWILRFRPAADRVDILRVTVCLLIVLPLVIALAPGLSLALLPPVEAAAALPVAPEIPRPSSTSPPPTPVETTIPRMFAEPAPAPYRASARVIASPSIASTTSAPGTRSATRSRSG